MAIRVDPKDNIAGISIRRIRDLRRSYADNELSEEVFVRELSLCPEGASEAMSSLVAKGFIERAPESKAMRSQGRYVRTASGRALANAKFVKQIDRAKAERLFAHFA